MIAVVLPTRGMVFTETEIALDNELRGKESRIFRSFQLGIPMCQQVLVAKALKENPSHILFIEEDTVIPKGALEKMLQADAPIACVNYSVAGWSCLAKDRKTGENLWCGLGCTLVKKEVFDVLEKPYFRTDKALLLNDWPKVTWVDARLDNRYGGQDIWFCMKAREKGFKIVQIEGECKHLKLDSLGTSEINNGLHEISVKSQITKHNLI